MREAFVEKERRSSHEHGSPTMVRWKVIWGLKSIAERGLEFGVE